MVSLCAPYNELWKKKSLLLSFILLSYIVVSNREIANRNIIPSILAMSNPLESKVVSENIQIGAPIGRTTILSMNSLRESSVMSKVSSIEYATHVEV